MVSSQGQNGFSVVGSPAPSGNRLALAGGTYQLAGRLDLGPSSSSSDFDPQPEPPGLPTTVEQWSGEGSAESAVNQSDGALGTGVSFGPGKIGTAFLLDGSGSRASPSVSFPAETANFGTADFTISFFTKTSVARSMAVLAKRPGCNHGNFWGFRLGSTGIPYVEVDEDTQGKNYFLLIGSSSIADNAWHHLALVREGTRISLYQDGALADSKTTVGVVPFQSDSRVVGGVDPCTDRGSSGFNIWQLEGGLDEIRFFRTALTPQQLLSVAGFDWTPTVLAQPRGETYNAPGSQHLLTVTARSLAEELSPFQYQWFRDGLPIHAATESSYAIHPVDGTTAGSYTVAIKNRYGSTVSQPANVELLSTNPLVPGPNHWWTGNGHASNQVNSVHGILSGNAEFGPGLVGQAFGFPGGHADLRGTVRFDTNVGNFGTRDFTIEYWLRTTNRALMSVLGKRPGCGHGNWWETFVSSNGVPFAQVDEDSQGKNYTSLAAPATRPVNDGHWHHLALVREGTEFRFFVDGDRVDAKTTTGIVPFLNLGSVSLGSGPCTDGGRLGFNVWPFAGGIDEIKVYHSALTDRQIAAAAERRSVPAALDPRAKTRFAIDQTSGPRRFRWWIEPRPDRPFTDRDAQEVVLESSVNLSIWTPIPDAVRLVNGIIEIVDPSAFEKRESFYRIVFRDPAATRAVRPGLATTAVPEPVRSAALSHIEAFLGTPDSRTPEDDQWSNVELGPEARHVHDPAYRNGAVPAYVELKVVEKSTGADRGFVLVSLTIDPPSIVEFATEGKSKTERAQQEVPDAQPQRFVRFTPGFLAMEDASGRLVGSLGTWPSLPAGAAPNESQEFSGEFDSETQTRVLLPSPGALRLAPPSYAALRSSFASNPTRTALRTLRKAGTVLRTATLGGSRQRLSVAVGGTVDVATDKTFAAVRVDADLEDGRPFANESVAVEAAILRTGGFRINGLATGSELIHARNRDGRIETYVVMVTGGRGPALAFSPACYEVKSAVWSVGTGWHGDQRQYFQPKTDLWCPAVGCGPVALAMLFGWWDVNGVPSAHYHLNSGFGNAANFRFNLTSLRTNAAKTMTEGYFTNFTNISGEFYILSAEERVVHDLHGLCNTFCVDGQGATYPDQLVAGAVEYLDRVVKNLASPQNEHGEQWLTANLKYSYTSGYWLGMTDWQGGGVKVANGIKEGRPGVVGLGDTLFDLHYALAYAYKRIDTYYLCDGGKELLGRTRWFKCNMGWGPESAPEWHDAESVWFGLTAKLRQKQVP